MDSPLGLTIGDAKSRGKRTWQAEFGSASDTGGESLPSAVCPPPSPSRDGTEKKRPRLSSVTAGSPQVRRRSRLLVDLPCELLQHIFTWADPISLGRLLCVNRAFHALLDPAVPLPPASGRVKGLPLRRQDQVWTASRRRFVARMPKPFQDMTELEMWRLVCGKSCQFCGKRADKDATILTKPSPEAAGPGPDGVRTIWPFRIKACGKCLEPRLIKELDLLVSDRSRLLAALPFAIFDASLNYLSSAALRALHLPPSFQLTKCYSSAQLVTLQASCDEARSLGPSALDGWFKGLEASGRQQNADAARFDQWEFQGGLLKTPIAGHGTDRLGAHDQISPAAPTAATDGAKSEMETVPPADGMLSPGPSDLRAPPALFQHPSVAPVYPTSTSTPTPQASEPPLPQAQGDGPVHRLSSAQHPTTPDSRQNPVRSLREAEEARADRQTEIQRRCQELDPPIVPPTLAHMEAFKAAILIPRPFDDKDWEILRPRLLHQREEAMQREQSHEARMMNPAMPADERRELEQEHRLALENSNHMWRELKIPAREKIQKYAREFIRQTWSDGGAVTKTTAIKFAAEVICHVRQRFDESIAQEDRMLALKGTAFPQDPGSLACRRLSLGDMKFVFEEFVKPHTERFSKALFLCRVCDANQKLFSFEAVIQHYAAKHTNALSHGNAVVYWKAEWPTDPPFDPSPNIPWVQQGQQARRAPAASPFSSPAWSSPLEAPPLSSEVHQARANRAIAAAQDVWQRTHGIWDLTSAVRLYIIIHHVNAALLRDLREPLTLDLFREILAKSPAVQFLHTISGVQCQICALRETSLSSHAAGQGMTHTLIGLLTHFQTTHLDMERTSAPDAVGPGHAPPRADDRRLNWVDDMIRLPSSAAIRALEHSPGITPNSFQVIVAAFPRAFEPALSGRMGSPRPQRWGTPPTVSLRDGHGVAYTKAGSQRSSPRMHHQSVPLSTAHYPETFVVDEYDAHRRVPGFPIERSRVADFGAQSPLRVSGRYDTVGVLGVRSPVVPPLVRTYSGDHDVGLRHGIYGRDWPATRGSMPLSYGRGSPSLASQHAKTTHSAPSVSVPFETRDERRLGLYARPWVGDRGRTESARSYGLVSDAASRAAPDSLGEGAAVIAVEDDEAPKSMSGRAQPKDPATSGLARTMSHGGPYSDDGDVCVRQPSRSSPGHSASAFAVSGRAWHARHDPGLPEYRISYSTDSRERDAYVTGGARYVEILPESLRTGRLESNDISGPYRGSRITREVSGTPYLDEAPVEDVERRYAPSDVRVVERYLVRDHDHDSEARYVRTVDAHRYSLGPRDVDQQQRSLPAEGSLPQPPDHQAMAIGDLALELERQRERERLHEGLEYRPEHTHHEPVESGAHYRTVVDQYGQVMYVPDNEAHVFGSP